MKKELLRYEWNPKTEIATMAHLIGGQVVESQVHQPIRVEPDGVGYWTSLHESLRAQGHECRGW